MSSGKTEEVRRRSKMFAEVLLMGKKKNRNLDKNKELSINMIMALIQKK